MTRLEHLKKIKKHCWRVLKNSKGASSDGWTGARLGVESGWSTTIETVEFLLYWLSFNEDGSISETSDSKVKKLALSIIKQWPEELLN